MRKKDKVFIIIPAYNEEKVIGSVIKGIKKEGFKNIVVIDDGSKDKTKSAASKEKAVVLRHIINRGKGAAVKTRECSKKYSFERSRNETKILYGG